MTSERGSAGALVLLFHEDVEHRDPRIQMAAAVAGLMTASLVLRRDVSELAGATGRTRRMLDGMPDPAVILDSGGRVCDLSATLAGLLGRQRDDLLGEHIDALIGAGEAGGLARSLAAVDEDAFERPVTAVRRDGTHGRFDLRARRMGNGRWLAVLHDHTRYAARDRSRRIMLDHIPQIAAAMTEDDLWERVLDAAREMEPEIEALRVYRGDRATLRLLWASDVDPAAFSLTLRGWGPRFVEVLQDPEQSQARGGAGPAEEVPRWAGQSADPRRTGPPAAVLP